MRCAKSEVSCENCKEHGSCPIYREYMIASSRPYSPYERVGRPIIPPPKWVTVDEDVSPLGGPIT